jgi:hypothetical protein
VLGLMNGSGLRASAGDRGPMRGDISRLWSAATSRRLHTVRYTELAPDRFKNFWR